MLREGECSVSSIAKELAIRGMGKKQTLMEHINAAFKTGRRVGDQVIWTGAADDSRGTWSLKTRLVE